MSFNPLNAAKSNLTTSQHRDRLGANRIGSIVQVAATQGGSLVEVARDDFVSDLSEAGADLMLDMVPKTKGSHAALCAAVGRRGKAVQKRVRLDGDDISYRFRWERLGIDSQHELSYALLFCQPDPEEKVWKSEQVATLRAKRDEHFTVADYKQVQAGWEAVIGSEVRETQAAHTKEMSRLHSDDVRKFINGVCDAASTVSLGGMLKLAPAESDEAFLLIESALNRVGYSVLVQPIFDGTGVRAGAENGLMVELERLSRDVNELNQAKADGKKANSKTFESRLARATSIQERARLYAGMVGMATGRIDATLVEVKETLRSLISEI